MAVRDVIVLDDSSEPEVECIQVVQRHETKAEVIELVSDGVMETYTAFEPPSQPSSSSEIPNTRDSWFASFYEKWVEDKEDAGAAKPTSSLVQAAVPVPVQPMVNEPAAEPKRRKVTAKQTNAPSTPRPVRVDAMAEPFCKPLGRLPRTKDEACQELTLVADDRLNQKLQLAPQMIALFKIRIERLEDSGLVCWRRRAWNLKPEDPETLCDVCALIMEVESHGPTIESDPEGFIKGLRDSFPQSKRFSQIYFILVGMKAFGQKVSTRINREFREAVLTGTRIPTGQRTAMTQQAATWAEIEQRLWQSVTEICSEAGIQSRFRLAFHETWGMAKQFVLDASRDVAWMPYNATTEKYSNGSSSVVNGKRQGTSPGETFRMMLSLILRLTPSMAEAIVKEYPTLKALMEAYQRAGAGAPGLLAGLRMSNGKGIGPSISARVHSVFTCRDPNALINQ